MVILVEGNLITQDNLAMVIVSNLIKEGTLAEVVDLTMVGILVASFK